MNPLDVAASLVQRVLTGEAVGQVISELTGGLPRPDCNPTNQC